jgi:hypothetical protein
MLRQTLKGLVTQAFHKKIGGGRLSVCDVTDLA